MNFKSTIWLSVFTVAVTVSCDQSDSALTKQKSVVELSNGILQTSHFTNLDLPASTLDVSQAQFINKEKTSIYIPFKGKDTKSGIVGFLDKNFSPRGVVNYELKTNSPEGSVEGEMRNGKFNGSFTITSEFGVIESELQNSKVVTLRGTQMRMNGRAAACAGFSEPGGALDCAGARLENMNWLDAGFCYAAFIPCMAQLTASCIIDGCAIE